MAEATSVEDRINLHQLMELKAVFERADTDGGGSLDIDEFLEAFGEVLGKNLSYEQLTHLFMKIDANSDGSVDWDEFTQFYLLENQAAAEFTERAYTERLQEIEPKSCDPNPKHVHHRDMIAEILHVSRQEKFYTSSRDGTVRVWHASTLNHIKTVKVSHSWVTSATHFEGSNRLAVASIDRSISFFDGLTHELLPGKMTELETSPLCVGTWYEQGYEKMIVGDDCGNIALYDVHDKSNETGAGTVKASSNRITRDKRHSDWVTKVRKYPDLNFMISSSLDGTLKLGELERSRKPNTPTRVFGETEKHATSKGVYNFTWSSTVKVLASCGLERTVSLWSPYTHKPKPVAVLQGHNASVLHVAIHDDGFQLFTCSTDKTLKVWDLRTHKCLQTIHDKTHYRPENKISAMKFDPVHMRLLTGTTKLRSWPLVKMAMRSANAGHEHPICAALYNKNFNQIVSGDESAQVCVWDMQNGDMVFHFTDLHKAKMTAMAFDEAGRRLITGANDGTTKMWNFNNGACLKEFQGQGGQEVSSIIFLVEGNTKYIVTGGWNRKVSVYSDDDGGAMVEPERMIAGHEEDILAIAYSSPNFLATSGYDGKLFVWNMDSGMPKFSLSVAHANELDVDQRAIWCLIFLDQRGQTLISSSADGMLRFWNVKEGSMVWQQPANHTNGEAVVVLATEPTNSFLFTGDGLGYIKVWDCCQIVSTPGLDQRGHLIELAHWRAHDLGITSLDYIEKHNFILSASSDTRIKMWSVSTEGVLLANVLGEWPHVALDDPSTFKKVELVKPKVPGASTSATTKILDDSADGDASSGHTSGQRVNAATAASANEPAAAPEPEHTTQDLISQILSKSSAKDPLKRSHLQAGTMHKLKIHELADLPPSPRAARK